MSSPELATLVRKSCEELYQNGWCMEMGCRYLQFFLQTFVHPKSHSLACDNYSVGRLYTSGSFFLQMLTKYSLPTVLYTAKAYELCCVPQGLWDSTNMRFY